VVVDGVPRGTTPFPEPLQLAAGVHEIVLKNPDEGIDETIRLELGPGERHRLLRRLGPSP
jgi:hypothetical protein